MNVPGPETVGSNEVPLTPVPEKTPPAGVPEKVTGGALAHIEGMGVIVGKVKGIIVTIILSISEQLLASVPVTKYWVVTNGEAITTSPVTEFNPVDGDHE